MQDDVPGGMWARRCLVRGGRRWLLGRRRHVCVTPPDIMDLHDFGVSIFIFRRDFQDQVLAFAQRNAVGKLIYKHFVHK